MMTRTKADRVLDLLDEPGCLDDGMLPLTTTSLSIGLPGVTSPDIIRDLAPRIEQAGFRSLWLNDNPGGDSLSGLAVAAEVTTTLRLASGVLPVSRRSAADIASSHDALGLPQDRLTLGIGSGNAPSPLAAVRESIAHLRQRTQARIVVGALGPRMRQLAAEEADGVLFNWLNPEALTEAMRELRSAAGASGGAGFGAVYVRASVEPDAPSLLAAEGARYASIASYAANFSRLGIDPVDTTIDARQGLRDSVLPFLESADEVVLRVVTADGSLDSYRRFLDVAGEAIAPI